MLSINQCQIADFFQRINVIYLAKQNDHGRNNTSKVLLVNFQVKKKSSKYKQEVSDLVASDAIQEARPAEFGCDNNRHLFQKIISGLKRVLRG
jgi:hypothetical protein